MPKLAANYLTVDPQGKVSAQFTGGLLLPIDPNNTPGTTSTSVTWTRSEDGSWLARITAARTTISPPAGDTAQMEVRSPNNAHTAEIDVQAYDTNNPPNQLGTGAALVHASADAQNVKIIDSLGKSSFNFTGGYGATFQGPWPVAVPPAGAGTAFNLTNPGTYIYWAQAAGYTTIGAEYVAVELWIDGVSRDQTRVYCNPANTHIATVARVGMGTFAAGNHTVYFRIVGGTSDNFDWGAFVMVRLGD